MLLTYSAAALLPAWLRRRESRPAPTGNLLVTGTFYNAGWFLSHLRPLSRATLGQVIVATDVPQPSIPGVIVLCPSRMSLLLLGRTGAKLLLMWHAARKYRPDLVMGYHMFPSGICSLIIGRLLGRPTAVQLTGGPVELIGGGYGCENVLLRNLKKPSLLLERLALATVRQFDLIVVRGRKACAFLAERGITGKVVPITGSVEVPPRTPALSERPIDMIFVGRLADVKQPHLFLEVVAKVAARHPEIRAVVVGGGPQRAALESRARNLEIAQNVEFLGRRTDVPDLLKQAKVFVLTSRSEGMAIAMIEAMACGTPAVVSDVGELQDLVKPGLNGFLVRNNDVEEYATRVLGLLEDADDWHSMSEAAHHSAAEHSGLESVVERWTASLQPFGCTSDRQIVHVN